ncbi:GTP-binding protein [Verticiella sediminum]|uniref:GTP-binding protein n=1 Tax=Verticiella sediminum TaxID=1247510 RepID=A0A556ABB9_9BURK|nr:GTP-binding protein [Verticiella sediminum]TSH90185.1 GTP-binding protein [Verticiella sediminum]
MTPAGPGPFVRDPLAGKLPVTLVTGFLGSGKTTLIARLLTHPGMNRVAVVINEVGEIGIDHDLVSMSSENVSLLANGCLCCVVRTDLQDTLRQLFGQRRAGRIADFDRVIIETSGLADPAPAVQTLATDTMLSTHYRLDGVVTLVDTVNGARQLSTSAECRKQIALADLIVLTKEDLAGSDAVGPLLDGVRTINASAAVRRSCMGDLDPSELTGLGLGSARAGAQTLRFLGGGLDLGDTQQTNLDGAYLGGRLPGARHDSSIRTLALTFEQPFNWSAFGTSMEALIALRGPDLFRVKGIVNVDGDPVVVQAVQHIVHPPVRLDRWPGPDRRTRLVFITRGMRAELIRGLFDAVGSLHPRDQA